MSSQIKKKEVRMSERDIKVQAIINPISGVGSKRKIPKMIEGICSKKNCSLNISFTEYAAMPAS